MSTKNIISSYIKELKTEENYKRINLLRSKTLATNIKKKKNIQKKINVQDCFQIMKNQRSNRGITDIENCMSLFKTFNSFYSYISLNNDKDESDKLLSELAWVIFHKKYKKNSLIKKTGEKNEYFYLLMSGKIQKVSLVFKKEKITLKEYLIYLLKMRLIKEFELLKKCRQLNKSIMDINYNNIEYFCERNPKYNYNELLKKATDDIINFGFDLKKINHHSDEYMDIPCIESYLKVGEIKKDIKSQNKGPTIYLYIPKYELSCNLVKGDYFGFLNKDIFYEYSSYICTEDCDLGYINKNKLIESSIFEQIDSTLSNYFYNNKNKFYIFKGIDTKIFNEKYSMYINYQKYKQGDKIFLQGSLNEGIYLIKDGEIKINIYSKINDLEKLMIKLIWSLKGFQEHVPSFEFKSIIKDNEDTNSLKDNHIYEDKEKLFDFGILKEGDILGLNELYDYKTSIYNFNAECVSKEVSLFYINKNNFNLILSKENTLYDSVIQKVELRIKYLIGTIKKYKNYKPLSIDNGKKQKKESSKNIINNNNNNNLLKYHESKPFIGKNMKQNFLYTSWNKTNDQNSSLTNEAILFSNKKFNNKNQNSFHLNTINSNLPNVRERIFKNELSVKSQDKIRFDKFNENNRINNYNNLLGTNLFKYISSYKNNCYDYNIKGSKLIKNKTFNNLITQGPNKGKFNLYSYTSPNNNLKKSNNNIFKYYNLLKNNNDILPILGKESCKGNTEKNIEFFKALYNYSKK